MSRASARPWSAREDRVVETIAGQVVAGKHKSVRAAASEAQGRLDQGKSGVRHSLRALEFRLYRRAKELGWKSGQIIWTDAENRIARRFSQAVIRGRYPIASAAVDDCVRALSRAGIDRLDRRTVRYKLIRQTRAMGRPRRYAAWDADSVRVLDRHALALARGRIPTVQQATGAAQLELNRRFPNSPRSEFGVRRKLIERARTLGRTPDVNRWTRAELRLLGPAARDLASGKLKDTTAASRAGLEALERAGNRQRRSLSAIQRKIIQLASDLGRKKRWTPTTAGERTIIERYAQAVRVGKYPTAHSALADCLRSLARAGLAGLRSEGAVSSMLSRRTAELGRARTHWRWLPAEKRLLEQQAQAVANGRYPNVEAAVADFQSAFDRARHAHPERFGEVPVRPRASLRSHLWKRVAEISDARKYGPWNRDEERLLERYAQAAIDHRYSSAYLASVACWKAIARLHRNSRSARRSQELRTLTAVSRRLYDRAVEIARTRLPRRRWTPTELRLARQWLARYRQYRTGKRRMNLATIAGVMQAELDRLGFYRTAPACRSKVLELYTRGTAASGNSGAS